MTTIDAVFRNGTFQPLGSINLPENSHVRLQVEPLEMTPEEQAATQEIYRLMRARFRSGHHDTAERHNEHQP
jgi:predicted DNA-binding antitoxin AbrB/MazE fold protein